MSLQLHAEADGSGRKGGGSEGFYFVRGLKKMLEIESFVHTGYDLKLCIFVITESKVLGGGFR